MTPSARTRIKTTFGLGTLTALMAVMIVNVGAQRSAPSGYISGTVRSSQGPEGGVWVIAETKDLPTNFIKIVVTDDRGRFMLPELPDANYRVWVRGYGLVDSTPVQSKPGATALALNATLAKTPRGSGQGVSRRLLAVAARAAGQERIPRHRRRRATASARRC